MFYTYLIDVERRVGLGETMKSAGAVSAPRHRGKSNDTRSRNHHATDVSMYLTIE